jgi:hypothetical protein
LGGAWVLDALWERLGIGVAIRRVGTGRRLDGEQVQRKTRAAWERVTTQYPRLFAHWEWVRYPLMIKMTGAE